MAATKLRIYQDALRLLADARLSLITDDVESRYALDDAWGPAIEFVLRQAAWRFALKTATLAAGGTPVAGYATAYAYPADWERTQAIFVSTSDGRESPFDLREQGLAISVNVTTAPKMRYVSSDYFDPALASHPWPEHFAQLVAAYLAFLVAERVTGERSAPKRMSEVFSSLLPEAIALDAEPEDRWLPHQRSGNLLRAVLQVLGDGDWKFATKTTSPLSDGALVGGYAFSFLMPTDLVRLYALYILSGTQECPFDVRQQDTHWLSNAANFTARYVSSTLGIDATRWPQGFSEVVWAFLLAEAGAEKSDGKGGETYRMLRDSALVTYGLPRNPWLTYQLDGSFLSAVPAVMNRGYWWWGLKEATIDTQLTTQPDQGFPYRFALPADRLRTHSLFVPWDGKECPINIRESANDWSTDASTFVARYVSTDVLDSTSWPEPVTDAVLAYLDWRSEADPQRQQTAEATFTRLLAEALALHSRKEDDWLRFQLDGSFIQAVWMVLEKARWRFAVKTVSIEHSTDPNAFSDGTVSPGYTYRLPMPLDWLRTLRLYRSLADGVFAQWSDIDYRDEGGAYHTNYAPAVLRYLSRQGLDATQWPANFRDAVLAWLEFSEARSDPKQAAVAARKLEFFERQCGQAETLDDERDVPRIERASRFVSARYGRSARSREDAWPPPF